MDVFYNPIFTRESSNTVRESNNPSRPSYPNEKMTFQPQQPQDEKFTFNPHPSQIVPKDLNFKQYKYENKEETDKDMILVDMSLQSSSLNNTSVLSVNQSQIDKQFFKNPLYDNSMQKKPEKMLYYDQQDQRKDFYPAYEDFNFSADKKKQEEIATMQFQLVDFADKSLDISKNQSRISIPQFTNPDFEGETSKNLKELPLYINQNPGSLLNRLDNKVPYDMNAYNKTMESARSSQTSRYEDKEIFKRTAEFKELGPHGFNSQALDSRVTFGSNSKQEMPEIIETSTKNINNSQNLNFSQNNMQNVNLSQNISKSYDMDEKSVLLDVSRLKDKVITALSKYKEQLTNPEKAPEKKKLLEHDYHEINKDFSVILDKYSNFNTSHMVESGYIGVSNSNISYLKTGGPNENEINNMMDLVQEYLEKFQHVKGVSRTTNNNNNNNINNNGINNGINNDINNSINNGINKDINNGINNSINNNAKNNENNSFRNSKIQDNSMKNEKFWDSTENAKKSYQNNNQDIIRTQWETQEINKKAWESQESYKKTWENQEIKKNTTENDFKKIEIKPKTIETSENYKKPWENPEIYKKNLEYQDNYQKTWINQPEISKYADFEKKNQESIKNQEFSKIQDFNKNPENTKIQDYNSKNQEYIIKNQQFYKINQDYSSKNQEFSSKHQDYSKNLWEIQEPVRKLPETQPKVSIKNKYSENPLELIEEMKRQRKREELEQSFLTIKSNNITVYDLDRTKMYTDLSYMSEISVISPNEKPKKTIISLKPKNSQINFFGFYPKIISFIKMKEEFIINYELDLVCDKCEQVFRGLLWQKHRNNCMNYRNSLLYDERKVDFSKNEEKIIQNLNKLGQKISSNKSYFDKELENKILYNIRIFLGQKTKESIENTLRYLSEFIDLMSKNIGNPLLLGYSIIQKRLINLIEEKNLKKRKNFNDNDEFYFDDIESDYEENKKITKSQPKIVNETITEKGNFKKKPKEEANFEEVKNYFFTEAVNLKFALPPNHPNRKILISDLFEEAMTKKVRIEEFKKFIQNKLKYI